ncbi:MAG: hypothetical protein ABR568_05695 [Pyrinomonadaceae bacterium]
MSTLIEDSSVCQTSSLLDRFPQERRSVIANRFFTATRECEGAATVDDVLRQVKAAAILRMVIAKREEWSEERNLLSALETNAAREYAQEVLAREALPPEEKRRLKAERQEHFRREHMRALTPTEKQLSYLKSRGCKTVPANRFEASQLIEQHK